MHPLQSSEEPPVVQPPRAPRRRARWLIPLSGLVLVLLVFAGFQGWQLLDAIVQAERSAVVPLPTRVPTGTTVVDDSSTITDGSAVSTQKTDSQQEPTRISDSGVAGSVNVVITPTIPATTIGENAAQATPAADDADNDDETSHLDVVRQVLGTGMDSGDPGQASVWKGKTSLNILVVGIDRRPEGGDQNADVIIIAHLDLQSKRVAAVSIPRDLLVTIPGIGEDKINSAYNYGIRGDPRNDVAGMAKVRDTIEDVFGIPIDGYVLVDFDGFRKVIDAIGGIDIDVPYEIVDPEFPTADDGVEEILFEPGMEHMDGERALQYVRTRHSDSDDGRRERQMQVLQALFDQGKQLSSIARADKLIVAAGSAVQTNFPLVQQLILARIAYGMDPTDIRWSSLTPPIIEPGTTENGAWVYVGDMDQIVAFVQDSLVTDIDRYQPAATPES